MSPVPQSSGSGCRTGSWRGPADGILDCFDVPSYVVSHWWDFLGCCVVSRDLDFVGWDSEPFLFDIMVVPMIDFDMVLELT